MSCCCCCWNIIWLHLFWFCRLVCDTQNAKLAISSLEANVSLIQRSKWLLNYRWVIFVEYFSTTLLINIRWALVSSFSDLWLSDNVFRLFSRCCLFKGSYTAYILITATNYTALWFIYWYETSYEFFVSIFYFALKIWVVCVTCLKRDLIIHAGSGVKRLTGSFSAC